MKRRYNGGIVLEVGAIGRVSWFHFLAVTKHLNKSHSSGYSPSFQGGQRQYQKWLDTHTVKTRKRMNVCLPTYDLVHLT